MRIIGFPRPTTWTRNARVSAGAATVGWRAGINRTRAVTAAVRIVAPPWDTIATRRSRSREIVSSGRRHGRAAGLATISCLIAGILLVRISAKLDYRLHIRTIV